MTFRARRCDLPPRDPTSQPSQRGPGRPAPGLAQPVKLGVPLHHSPGTSSATPRFCPHRSSRHLPQLHHPSPIPSPSPAHSLAAPFQAPPLLWRIVYTPLVLRPSSPNSHSPSTFCSLGPRPSQEPASSSFQRRRNWSSAMTSNVWHNWTTLRFLTGFLPYLEAGAGWFVQVREAVKVKVLGYNNNNSPMRGTPSPHVTHKIKMASMHMSMDDISKTYKITPVRR